MARHPSLVVRTWPLCQDAIETGIQWGFQRWYKYRDKRPLAADDEASLKAQLQHELQQAFSERFRWEDESC